jgi:hypothetical protein
MIRNASPGGPPLPRLLAFLLLSACRASGGDAETVVVRDSAGVEIVESRGAAWTEATQWRLSPQSTLQIGKVDGAEGYRFVRIASALRRSDGVIAVADAGQHQVRFYDGQGVFLRAAGGEGEGPGEFRQMGSAFQLLPGDTVVAYDIQLRRFSFFDRDGRLVRASGFRWSPDAGFPRPLGVLSDGSVLVTIGSTVVQGQAKAGMVREPAAYLRTTAEGKVLDTVAVVPGGEQFVTLEGGSLTVTPPLFGRYPVHAFRGGQVAIGSNEAYEVGVYSPDGRLRRVIRCAVQLRPVTDSDWDAQVAKNLEAMDPEWRRSLEAIYGKMPRPAAMPYYSAALFDDVGNLWLESFRAPADSRTVWTVFDPKGRMLGEVSVPDGFRPTHIGDDFVLGVGKDDMDVEYVRRYALLKGGRTG